MSGISDRSTSYSQPQEISGILNFNEPSPGPPYPNPVTLQTTTNIPVQTVQARHEISNSTPSTPGEVKPRLRKACDSCSVRKVKCDESGPPCRSCAALDIPCTFQRPSKRRGPPNRHAEAIKRQRLNISPSPGSAVPVDELRDGPMLSVESICPLSQLGLLVDDYFTYIHPLIPLPHEPTYRLRLGRRDDLTDKIFLALTANMVAVLVASFPRRPRQLFSSEEDKKRFPNAGALIKVCNNVAAEALGPAHLLGRLTLDHALCAYLSAISWSYVFDFRRGRLCFGECLLILRDLKIYRPDDQHSSQREANFPDWPEDDSGVEETDFVKREMGRRLFWVVYAGLQTLRQIGSRDAELLMPPLSKSDPPPPLPLEIDDAWISATQITEQPSGLVSELTGFNANVAVMKSWNSLDTFEMTCRFNDTFDPERQKQVLAQCMHSVKTATDNLPAELLLSPPTSGGWPSLIDPYFHSRRQDPWATDIKDQSGQIGPTLSRKKVQFEIQKANIYATQLAARSYLVEKYWALREVHDQLQLEREAVRVSPKHDPVSAASEAYPSNLHDRPTSRHVDAEEQAMAYEREDIVRDLAILLSNINQVNMEPNGISFVSAGVRVAGGLLMTLQSSKIRQVASTLLHKPKPAQMTMSTLDYESMQQYLAGFIDILMKLERLGPGIIDTPSPSSLEGSNWLDESKGLTPRELEERELVQWASLKEHQEKFTSENGFVKNF